MKSIEDSFTDWEANTFGFGYGTGEEHTIAALKAFMGAIGRKDMPNAYDYRELETACGQTAAWLLINTFCHHRVDLIDYGTSPRFGWLNDRGMALKAFVDSHTTDELIELTRKDQDYNYCYPNACNCGPNGYEKDRKCLNPFWVCR